MKLIPVRIRSETRKLSEDSAIARQGEVDKVSLLMRIGITRIGADLAKRVSGTWCECA
ncbi:hypothetical protein AGMMS49545_08470 [Betaproteobacteria bacterium]|nr:hypothetical protein AGMMS49545_08470 [Betaproteobacteria bacterium]GHU41417.1 hypothetical protein AGMMS50289_04530 [Betaproteobacteria bacterium]